MSLNEPKKTQDEEDYERGQEDGSKAKIIDELWQDTFGQTEGSDSYNKGFENGRNNKPD